MKVSVINPKKVVYEGNALMVVLPGEDGELTMMDFHESALCALRDGLVRIQEDFGGEKRGKRFEVPVISIKIKRGIARILANELIMMVET
ncbi:MAG: hypothetical protein KAJ18_04495 [Candidatus Omnitrophica bacterium]|nr:hypothetical protein [Candidatus Omnitrophota bacterium]